MHRIDQQRNFVYEIPKLFSSHRESVKWVTKLLNIKAMLSGLRPRNVSTSCTVNFVLLMPSFFLLDY